MSSSLWRTVVLHFDLDVSRYWQRFKLEGGAGCLPINRVGQYGSYNPLGPRRHSILIQVVCYILYTAE